MNEQMAGMLAFNPNDPKNGLHPGGREAKPGFCQATVGGLYIWKLHDWGVLCTRQARYNAIVHISDHPDDALEMRLCGQHVHHFEAAAGMQVEKAERPRRKTNGFWVYLDDVPS